jgi:hypothetical protein
VRRASKIFFVENGQLKLLSQPAPLSQPGERIAGNVTPLLTVDA